VWAAARTHCFGRPKKSSLRIHGRRPVGEDWHYGAAHPSAASAPDASVGVATPGMHPQTMRLGRADERMIGMRHHDQTAAEGGDPTHIGRIEDGGRADQHALAPRLGKRRDAAQRLLGVERHLERRKAHGDQDRPIATASPCSPPRGG